MSRGRPDAAITEALARVCLASSGNWGGTATELRAAVLPYLPAYHRAHDDPAFYFMASRARDSKELLAERYGVYLIRYRNKHSPFVLRLTRHSTAKPPEETRP